MTDVAAESVRTLIVCGALGFILGLVVGRLRTSALWRQRGDRGYPQFASGGTLYWVGRADRPCFRCSGGKAPAEKGRP